MRGLNVSQVPTLFQRRLVHSHIAGISPIGNSYDPDRNHHFSLIAEVFSQRDGERGKRTARNGGNARAKAHLPVQAPLRAVSRRVFYL